MRLLLFRTLVLLSFLYIGTYSIADEIRLDGQCSGIDSQHDCVQLGELNDSVLLVGIFGSCTESGYAIPPGSEEDPASSVIYQFNLTHIGIVKLDADGLGIASILMEDAVVFLADKNMASVSHRFEPGHYTLIGRAPLCEKSKADWNGGYKIRIGPHGANESNARETVKRTGDVVVMSREERKPLLGRVGKRILIISGSVIGFILLLLSGT